MSKTYSIIANDEIKRKLVRFYVMFSIAEQEFNARISIIEKKMRKETKIKDIEFFFADNELAGIGNESRTMQLIHRSELDDQQCNDV